MLRKIINQLKALPKKTLSGSVAIAEISVYLLWFGVCSCIGFVIYTRFQRKIVEWEMSTNFMHHVSSGEKSFTIKDYKFEVSEKDGKKIITCNNQIALQTLAQYIKQKVENDYIIVEEKPCG